jgi:hypothetical protein
MKTNKPLILRPIAWLFTCLAIIALPIAAEYVCKLGGFLVGFLDNFSTLIVIILVLMFGSIYLSLFVYSATILPSLLVSISNLIYPTHHAFRFYFVGVYLLIFSASLIIAGILGFVSGGPMFWYYARYGWLAFSALMLMLTGRSSTTE